MQPVFEYVQREAPLNEKFNNTVKYGSASFLFILAAFPFISPINLGFDTQPFCLAFSFLLSFALVVKRQRILMTKGILALLLVLVFAMFMFVLSPNKAAALRSLAGYLTLFFVTYAAYNTSGLLKIKWFNASVYVWFGVGLIQTGVSKYFGSFLLPRMTSSATRGITSLAVEPSICAIVCVFLLLINDLLKARGVQTKKKHAQITVLLVLLTAMTLSGMGFLFIFVYLLSKVVAIIARQGIAKHAGKIFAVLLVLLITFISFRTVDSLEQSRAGTLLSQAIDSPRMLVLSDVSLADRLSNVILPIYSLPYSKGLGLGLGTWATHSFGLTTYAGGFVQLMSQHASLSADRIMSGWGTAFYELGFFGVIYLIVFLNTVRKGIKKKNELSSVYISIGISVTFIMALAIPLAFPLFSYLLGMIMYYNYYPDKVSEV